MPSNLPVMSTLLLSSEEQEGVDQHFMVKAGLLPLAPPIQLHMVRHLLQILTQLLTLTHT